MKTLPDYAVEITEKGLNASHPSYTVLVALKYVQEESVNYAWQKLSSMKEKGAPPRWLVRRWANYATLIDDSSRYGSDSAY